MQSDQSWLLSLGKLGSLVIEGASSKDLYQTVQFDQSFQGIHVRGHIFSHCYGKCPKILNILFHTHILAQFFLFVQLQYLAEWQTV